MTDPAINPDQERVLADLDIRTSPKKGIHAVPLSTTEAKTANIVGVFEFGFKNWVKNLFGYGYVKMTIAGQDHKVNIASARKYIKEHGSFLTDLGVMGTNEKDKWWISESRIKKILLDISGKSKEEREVLQSYYQMYKQLMQNEGVLRCLKGLAIELPNRTEHQKIIEFMQQFGGSQGNIQEGGPITIKTVIDGIKRKFIEDKNVVGLTIDFESGMKIEHRKKEILTIEQTLSDFSRVMYTNFQSLPPGQQTLFNLEKLYMADTAEVEKFREALNAQKSKLPDSTQTARSEEEVKRQKIVYFRTNQLALREIWWILNPGKPFVFSEDAEIIKLVDDIQIFQEGGGCS